MSFFRTAGRKSDIHKETMKAIQYYSNDDVRVVELPQPSAGPGELLVRVAACGVCASDVMEWYMRPRAPLFIGHEPVGTVAEVGAGAAGFAPGDRVFVHHHVPCLDWRPWRRGHQTLCATIKRTRLDPSGKAEYNRVPAEQVALDVLKLPDSISFAHATLIEPVGCCVRALDRAEIAPDDSVVIIGAGFNGLVMTVLARRWGAGRVFVADRIAARLGLARAFGADAAFDVDAGDTGVALRAANHGRLADVVIVAVGKLPALRMGIELAGPGATVMLYGPSDPDTVLDLAPNRLFFEEITLRASYSCGPGETRRTMELLAAGALQADRLITHRFPLDQAGQALRITANPGQGLKTRVTME
jgi:L-iditol 2-dehydrogenase